MARILIAEDDASMRQFLAVALRKAGHTVDDREDGLEALDALGASAGAPYDLLLADIVMPGMDGIELAQKASALFPALKVMFITGFAGVALAQRTPIAPDAKIMSKPFHLKDLVDRVEEMLTA